MYRSIGNLALNASQKNKFSDDILYVDESSPETQLDVLDESVEYIDEDVRNYLLNIKKETGDDGTSKCTEKLDFNKKRPLLEIENQQKKKKKPQPLPPEERLISMLEGVQKTIVKKDDTKDDTLWNFCISLYGSMKKMTKTKVKNVKFKISQLLYEFESDSEN